MVTDYYRDVYNKKLDYKGESLKSKNVTNGIKAFERYLETTPTRQQIIRNDETLFVAIQKSQQTLVGDRYEKDILGSLSDNFKIGDIFEWEDEKWIIITENRLTIPTHFKGKIRLCNYSLKWNHQHHLYEIPGHIITSRAFALEEGQKAGLTWEEGGMVVQAIIPKNQQTLTITRNKRFILKEQAWRVVSIDILSVDNLLFIRLEEDKINLATDDMEQGIADKYIQQDDTGEIIEGKVYTIEGPDKLVSNQTGQYYAKEDEILSTSVLFSIDDPILASLISSSVSNPIEIKSNSQGITGKFILSCEFVETGVVITKEIRVTSLWG